MAAALSQSSLEDSGYSREMTAFTGTRALDSIFPSDLACVCVFILLCTKLLILLAKWGHVG